MNSEAETRTMAERLVRRLGMAFDEQRYVKARDDVRPGMLKNAEFNQVDRTFTSDYNGYDTMFAVSDDGGVVTCSCKCPDYTKRVPHGTEQITCKHTLALILFYIECFGQEHFEEVNNKFISDLGAAIAKSIAKLTDLIESVVREGEIPFLLGPTGVGKTTAVREVARRMKWSFEEVAGSPSFADADLVGLRTDHMLVPGIIARTFTRARLGEHVLSFFDEALRFNVRSQDILMRPLQVMDAEIARAMGIDTDVPVRIVEAPLWGVEHAPAEYVHFVLAANPWGSSIDPALVRRLEIINVGMDQDILAVFDEPLRGIIESSWKSQEHGELPLPMEYGLLSRARNSRDEAIVKRFINKIGAIDKASAEGFRHIAKAGGMSV